MKDLRDFTYQELITELGSYGISRHWADRLWQMIYRDRIADAHALAQDWGPWKKLGGNFSLWSPELVRETASSDGMTRKLLLGLHDSLQIETVVMRYRGRNTVCVSTQVGCAMGCTFCATGQLGFRRHLTAGEIVAQVMLAAGFVADGGEVVRNIVFMGMGEPFHNYENSVRALDILTEKRGLAIAPRKITVSTVGIPAAIRLFADQERLENLAVSLHFATDLDRQRQIPTAKKWSLEAILDACRYYSAKSGRRLFIEWALIDRQNDTAEQANALGQLLHDLDSHVNLIPLNPTAFFNGTAPADARISTFRSVLGTYGVPSTLRQRRGIDIAAGCGQLAASHDAEQA